MISNKSFRSILSFIMALILAIIFRSFLYEPFHIPSSSMNPNLFKGDYILVSKYSYGYSRYSFPFGFPIFGDISRVLYHEPKRGDVVVFKLPRSPDINYIKRVVGLPGDKLQVKNGVLHINGISVKTSKVEYEYDDDDEFSSTCYLEEPFDGISYKILTRFFGKNYRDTEIYSVPEGHFFVMGDNRDNSTDSRFLNDVGFIPIENLVGKAEVVVLSLNSDNFLFLNFSRFWKYISP